MGLHKSKLAHHEPVNVESQRYKRLEESRVSNGFDSRNKSCAIQSHKDAWTKNEPSTKENRITTPSAISCHETNSNQSIKENRDSKNRHPKDSDTESQCPPDVLDGQQCCIQPSLSVLKNDESTTSMDTNCSPDGNDNIHTEDNMYQEHDEKDDIVTETSKKKQNQSKKKKKKKATAERLSKRMVIPEQSEPHCSANTTEDIANDSEGKLSSRNNGRLPDEPFIMEKTRQEKNNMHDGNDMTRHGRPSSADMFLASGVWTKKNEDEIIRQEPDIKIQAMTEEAERLETICKNQHFKQRHSTQDHSHCPPSFLQTMLHIEDHLYDLRVQIDVIKREKNDYVNRLSSVAGSMLTENNPNITDLNDPNRATKLAEKWCKIYDDEWTDALESLEKKYSKKNHEQYVHHLFSLVKVIYKTCRKKTKEQVGIFLLLNNPSSTQVNDMWSQLSVPVRQNFNDNRKQMAEANIKMLQETVIQDDIYKTKIREINPALNEEILDVLQKSSYFETCLKICWQFVIQDPPLYLDVAPLKGDKLNKDTHKEYTRSGTVIKYVVWPALYLYCTDKKKGPLLSKGVVQPEDLTIDH